MWLPCNQTEIFSENIKKRKIAQIEDKHRKVETKWKNKIF